MKLGSISLPDWVQALEKAAGNGWRRDPGLEATVRGMVAGHTYVCFLREGHPRYSPASVWMIYSPPGNLKVANVLSERFSELSIQDYNALLDDFHTNVIQPAAAAMGVPVRFTNGTMALQDLAPPSVVDKLRVFASSGNRASAAGHPQDFNRWLDFITEAHRRRCELPAQVLGRWLQEEEHWPRDTAERLAVEYEFARDLLKVYDDKRG
jgi:hypothetical protein